MRQGKKTVRINEYQFSQICDHLPPGDYHYFMDVEYGDHGILQLYTDFAIMCYELVIQE